MLCSFECKQWIEQRVEQILQSSMQIFQLVLHFQTAFSGERLKVFIGALMTSNGCEIYSSVLHVLGRFLVVWSESVDFGVQRSS